MSYSESNTGHIPVVSVIIPVYNCERYLEQTIESVLSQTFSDFELLLIDDCSTDGSYEIARKYAEKDSRIQVLRNDVNSGVAKTRNLGITHARGEYIALLDSDDLWFKDKLQKQIDTITRSGVQITYCSYNFIDDDGVEIKTPFIVPVTTDYDSMLIRSVFTCSTIMVRSEVFKENRFDTELYHEDYILWMRLMEKKMTAVGDPEMLASYRQLRGSRSNNRLHSAKHRWKIYREALGLSFGKSVVTFVKYAYYAVRKYYL